MSRALVIAIASTVVLGAGAVAQQPPPTRPAAPPPSSQRTPAEASPQETQPPVVFRVEVNYVEVDAIVTDRSGNVVGDLKREDFQVLEDGRPQKVELFTFVDIPIERLERPLFSPTAIEPDVRTNERPFEGRLYVILLDDLHTSLTRSAQVKRAAKQFIERYLGQNDLAAVVHVSGRTSAGQEFTTSKRLLTEAVDKFIGRRLRSATLNKIDQYNQRRELGVTSNESLRDPEAQERAYNARSLLGTVKNVADYLNGVRGRRKAVVLFSEGIDYDITNVFENRDATTIIDETRDAVGAATRAGVSFYTIDPRGLYTLGDETMELTPVEDTSLGLDSRGLQSELLLSQDSLRTLAEETGGVASINANDFRQAFDRIVRDNSSYYVLGYYPTNDRRDGRFRRIEVRLNRPGLEVRARKGYQAPKTKLAPRASEGITTGTSTVLRTLLDSPLPEAGLPLGVHAAAFRGAGKDASVLVTVQFSGRQLKFAEKDGQLSDTIELSLIAVDDGGKIRGGDRSSVELKPRPERLQVFETGGFRMMSRIDLPPGRYQLRVAGRTANSGAAGVVHYDLEVPDFTDQSITMSGLVLASSLSGLVPTARADEELKAVLPGPPTIAREFPTIDTLALFTEIYDNEADKLHKVDIITTLRADDGRVVFKTEDERSSDEIKGRRGGYGCAAQIPLKDVAPGLYVLRVEARSRLSGSQQPQAREVQLRVFELRQPQASARPAAQGRSLVPVTRGPQSGVEQYREVVARTEEEWAALWASLPIDRAAPRVTFTSTMIAAVFLGSRPTAGYGVELLGVKLDGETLVVEYKETTPSPDAVTAQVLTTPFAIAGVPMHAGPVKFVKVSPAP